MGSGLSLDLAGVETLTRRDETRNVREAALNRWHGWLAWGGLVLGLVPTAGAQLTNYELVVGTARETSRRLLHSLDSLGVSQPLSLRPVGNHAGKFLVENALAATLADQHLTVSTREDSAGMALEFEVVDLGLAYTRVRRRSWLGEKRVVREGRARVFARLLDLGAARVVWADHAEAKVRDEVRFDDLKRLEEQTPPDYVKATLPERRWNKIVEPAVVTGIVVGLIVLFFSNQDTQ